MVELGSYYEKVVRVKADVAALLKVFFATLQIEAHHDAAPVVPIGAMRKGGFQRRFETALAGGAAALMCASAFAGTQRASGVGGNPPAPAFPRRGKRERGRSDFLAAAGSSRRRNANVGHAAGLLCARSSSKFLSFTITNNRFRSAQAAFQKSCRRQPLLAVLLSAL